MKRITLLAVLVLAVALPAMATDFTWSGHVEYGQMTDFTNVTDLYNYARIQVVGAVDANNSVTARLNTAFKGTTQVFLNDPTDPTKSSTLNAFTVYADRFMIDSNLGAMLGLSGITLKVNAGWNDVTGSKNDFTNYDYESIIGYDPGARDNIGLVLGFGAPLTITVATSPFSSTAVTTQFKPQILASATGGFGPILYALDYTSYQGKVATTDYKGHFGADLKFAQAFGDISPAVDVEFDYDLATGAVDPWMIGAAVGVGYKSLVTVNLCSSFNASAGKYGVEASVVPMKNLGIDVGVTGNIMPSFSFEEAEGSVWWKPGAAKFRAGYVYNTTAFGTAWATMDQDGGGLFLDVDLSF